MSVLIGMALSHIIVYTYVTSSFTLLSYNFSYPEIGIGGRYGLEENNDNGAENRVY